MTGSPATAARSGRRLLSSLVTAISTSSGAVTSAVPPPPRLRIRLAGNRQRQYLAETLEDQPAHAMGELIFDQRQR